MRQYYNDSGVIIKTQDYKEADKIITLVTSNHGLVYYHAIGARRSASKKSPHLDLFSHIKFGATVQNNQNILTQADSLNYHQSIKIDLKKISLAMSFSEILHNLLPAEVEDTELYSSLVNFLDALDKSPNEEVSRQISGKFGHYLLRHLGYPPPPKNSNESLSTYFEYLMNRKIIGKEIS